MDDSVPVFNIVSFFPKDFRNKNVNEPFIQKIMSSVLPTGEWQQGDPGKFEPDYFLNGTPFEFTIASDSKKKNNFIQQLFLGKYSSDDVEQDVFSYITERIHDKSSKKYSVENVHLCILCLLDLSNWVLDYYGSVTHALVDYSRQQFFEKTRSEFIDTKVFSNIFILFPDPCAKWWIYDVRTESRAFYELTDDEIKSGKVPFVMYKEIYDKIFPPTLNE